MSKVSLYKDIRLYTFLGIIAFLFIHHYGGYFGHYGFDDIMGYGYYGKKWADGELFFLNEDFFSYRWGFISLTGFFYALFGVNDDSSALGASLVLLWTVLLLFRILRHQERNIAVLAALIYVLDNWTMYYSDKLMPDTSVALATLAAFGIIANYRFDRNSENSFGHALLLSIVLIWAYIAKQSVLLLFPVFFLLLLIDVFQKRYLKFWIYTIWGCIVMGLLYLLFIYYLTGDAFSRFHAVEAGLEDNLGEGRSFAFCNYAVQSWSALWYRVGYQMILKAMATGMMVSLMLAIPAIFSHKFKDFIRLKSPEAYWALILVLSALSSNFMTTSYKAYLPICPDIRHFLFLVPMAAIVAAPILHAFAKEKRYKRSFWLVGLVVVTMSIYSAVGNLGWVYVAILGGIIIRSFLPNTTYAYMGFLVVVLLAAFAPIFSSMKTANKHSYVEQRAVIYKYLKEKPHKSIVITNIVQKHIGQYLMEFDEDGLVQFYDYSTLPDLIFPENTTVYVLANGGTRYMSNMTYDKLPRCIKDCYEGKHPTSITTIYETKEVALYKLNQPTLLKEGNK